MPRQRARAEIFQSQSVLGFLEIRMSEYSEELRQGLLDIRPTAYRRWNPGLSCWLVHRTKMKEVTALLKELHIDMVSPQTNIPKLRPRKQSGPYDVLCLTSKAPDELISAAYRVMAQLYHPDHGGTTAKMAEINLAYEQIKRERGKGN